MDSSHSSELTQDGREIDRSAVSASCKRDGEARAEYAGPTLHRREQLSDIARGGSQSISDQIQAG